jgi:hypothetical protein
VASAHEIVPVEHQHALEPRDVDADTVLGSTDERGREVSLSSVGNPAWDTIRGVRFAMRNGPTLVAILVTHDAVDDVEKAAAGDGSPLVRFNKHRNRFELAASAKHQRGQCEEDGLVIVDVADVKSAGH